jgi:hypothetical protein
VGADAIADPTAEDVPLPPVRPAPLPSPKPKAKVRWQRKW